MNQSRMLCLSVIVSTLLNLAAFSAQTMDEGFASPPDETKPWVYWYWLDGDLSREGITKDLEAMSRAGIGEALIGHINQQPENSGVQVLGEDWWQLVDHAVSEGRRLGVDIGMFNSPGWSQSGGPWIEPEDSMQYVVSSEMRIEGPAKITRKLPVPEGAISDIAVLAFPANDSPEYLIENNHPAITFNGREELLGMVNEGNGRLKVANVSNVARPDITKAQWVWFPEGNPRITAPAGNVYFRCKFVVPADAEIAAARLEITADNAQWVWVNGEVVDDAFSTDWRNVNLCDITGFLKAGENVIAVKANNLGPGVSAAGLIASVKICLAGGEELDINTGSDWLSEDKYFEHWNETDYSDAHWQNVAVLGANGEQPWNKVRYANSSCSIDWELSEEFTARSLSFAFTPPHGLTISGTLEALGENGEFETLEQFSYSRSVSSDQYGDSTMFLQKAPVIYAFKPAESKHFRLTLDRYDGVSDIKLSSAAKVENVAEKQLGRLWPTPQPNWDSYLWPQPEAARDSATAIETASVIDLTAHTDSRGVLSWKVPQGQWVIKRFATASTKIVNRPAAAEATGLECDKMSKEVVEKHFDAMVGKSLERLSDDAREAVKHVVIDSYEVGGQNWTSGFAEIFEQRLGYSPLPYLPVLDGAVVGSPDVSERFLWDLRRLVADLISENYVGGLKKIANDNGLKLWLENYGHWGYPGEFLQYGGYADQVSGEFWATGNLGSIELRDASSCAHTYGKGVVSAEAFTSGLNLSDSPYSLKARGDWAYTEGINHFVLHVYAHQSEDLPAPGRNPWFGTPFHRNNPWFLEMRSWVDYLQRCHFMLQQGLHVADVAYFIGEDAPKMCGVRSPELPAGYNYDYINADVIKNSLTIKNGRWTLPDGMSYRVLVLPPLDTMRPELLRKIRDLVRKGGVLSGTAPVRSPSLAGYPACDKQVERLAAEIWAGCDGAKQKQRNFGRGQVFNGLGLAEIFSALDIAPEITISEPGVLWTHRADSERDIYFISNQNDRDVVADISVRVSGRAPEIWNPVTGEMTRIARFAVENGRTNLSVAMGPSDSVFVVFCDERESSSAKPEVSLTLFDSVVISTDWNVLFPQDDSPYKVKFEQLQSWSAAADERIKSFTGKASYSRKFTLPEEFFASDRRIKLSLGEVSVMAAVRLNGRSFDTLWKPPFELDITGAAKPGENVIEIDVTNAYGRTPAGLLGPVQVSASAVVQVKVD
ncbi:MAG: glycosyl hydrolase [Phycisphaerae bacterium]